MTNGSAPGTQAVTKFLGRRAGSQFSVTLSRADAEDVRQRIRLLGLDGPGRSGASEFFRRLLSEGRGARLPIMGQEEKP